eukprot:3834433-Prymnesium_polylepis.2
MRAGRLLASQPASVSAAARATTARTAARATFLAACRATACCGLLGPLHHRNRAAGRQEPRVHYPRCAPSLPIPRALATLHLSVQRGRPIHSELLERSPPSPTHVVPPPLAPRPRKPALPPHLDNQGAVRATPPPVKQTPPGDQHPVPVDGLNQLNSGCGATTTRYRVQPRDERADRVLLRAKLIELPLTRPPRPPPPHAQCQAPQCSAAIGPSNPCAARTCA